MIADIWHIFLFQPLYNILILIYNNWTDQSLGWAVVYLTLMLRLLLLPLTIMTIVNQRKNEALDAEVHATAKQFQHDPVLQKLEVRRLLKSKRVSPWAKALSLGIQALVVLLLYEVFLYGLEGTRVVDYLYPWVEYPGKINTIFLGFDIGETHSVFWAGLVAIWLFIESFIETRAHSHLEKKDLAFLFLFPGAIFVILWILPIMKAIFFFTSILFSMVVGGILKLIIKPAPVKAEESK